MITPSKPLFGYDKVEVKRDDPKLTIEGKWANIRRLIKQLEVDGYKYDTPEVSEWHGERFSVVEMRKVVQ